MSYNPLQARDKHGRWVAKIGNASVKKVLGGKRSRSLQTRYNRQRTVAQRMPGTDSKAKLDIGSKAAANRRGTGIAGLKKNTIPYARVNKRSQTVGVNAGTIIPGTKKRVVVGGYVRVESTTKTTGVDKAVAAGVKRVAPKGTKRGVLAGAVQSKAVLVNPAVRGSIKGSQVRLGTSRSAGATVIVRRGKHKTAQPKSASGVQKYDRRMRTIAGAKVKQPRAQRRKASRRKR